MLLEEADDHNGSGIAHNNFGLLLTNRGESGDIERAVEHHRLALPHRTRHRNPTDWATSQLNFGFAYSRLGTGGSVENMRRAILHTARARYVARVLQETQLIALTEHNLAAQQRQLSEMDEIPIEEQSRLLMRAEVSGHEAVRLIPSAEDPLRFGQAWLNLGQILLSSGQKRDSMRAFERALSALSTDLSPADARKASRHLMALAMDLGDLNLAANAAERLVEATSAVIASHSRASDRYSEHSGSNSTDFRFAAGVLAQVGRHEKALVAIESGRARELELLTLQEQVDRDALSHLDPHLAEQFDELNSWLRTDILGSSTGPPSNIAEQLSAVRAEIGKTPTFENKLRSLSLAEIGRAAQPQHPLVYLGAAPNGAFAIIVEVGENGEETVESFHVPACDSAKVAQLMFGIDTSDTLKATTSYLLAQAEQPHLIDASLNALSPLVGELLLHPLSDLLGDRGSESLTIVPTGLFGLLPLHAIAWKEPTRGQRCLIDDFVVSYAPSARLYISCLQRASRHVPSQFHFVGVANPLPHSDPLPGAELELDLVEQLLPQGDTTLLKRHEATKKSVVRALESATHVHLACHAGAQFYDSLFAASFSFSGEEELSALEIARLEIPARLVVASACETGVIQGYEEVDESLALATAFIASGAAGVVASLWSIDDFATALVMSKFYEGLFGAGMNPPAALRAAQLWLRDADGDAVERYVAGREVLRTRYRNRGSDPESIDDTPYKAPYAWAGFVFTGS